MNKFTVAMKRFGGFMKRNAFYFVIVLLIASVAAVIALAVTRDNGAGGGNNISVDDGSGTPVVKPDDGDKDDPKPEEPEKLTFIAPTNGTVKKEYAGTTIVWNPTLEQYETHEGVDFISDDLNVFASAKGTVKETGWNELDGFYVVLSHDEGYETVYKSLEKECALKAGAKVDQGQNLGKISASQGTESLDGAHLHFEMMKDGKNIDPLTVIVMDEK